MSHARLTRRRLLAATGAALILPVAARAQQAPVRDGAQQAPVREGAQQAPVREGAQQAPVRHNISGFAHQDWRTHFSELGKGAIVCDTVSRALHFWSGDGSDYRVFPTSVPKTDELTKRGYTRIVRKKIGPSWTPTASQMERFPDWKPVAGGAPDNPLGTHAMYFDWPAYLIHGTHDTRKIGRRSSDGCIGLYNNKIEELYQITEIGTQVRLI